jgi:hypothetical protein
MDARRVSVAVDGSTPPTRSCPTDSLFAGNFAGIRVIATVGERLEGIGVLQD